MYADIFITSMMGRMPVSIAERSKAGTVYDRLTVGIAVSNPA
jgi:hypothetical protein